MHVKKCVLIRGAQKCMSKNACPIQGSPKNACSNSCLFSPEFLQLSLTRFWKLDQNFSCLRICQPIPTATTTTTTTTTTTNTTTNTTNTTSVPSYPLSSFVTQEFVHPVGEVCALLCQHEVSQVSRVALGLSQKHVLAKCSVLSTCTLILIRQD